jgi:23S rRNA (pseudouridine1915-N3)-methyltransferase
MKIALLCIGRPRGAWLEIVQDYEKRLRVFGSFETICHEVKGGMQEGVRSRKENEFLHHQVHKKYGDRHIIGLERQGKMLSSAEMGHWLSERQRMGKNLLFMIGGACGLQASLVQECHELFSLSKMTLPHKLARVFLVEQLYRAFTILQGGPYHK